VHSGLYADLHGAGLTLAQVAEASGLTKGFLSRLERDETSPSLATLVQLCQVLPLTIGSLFVEPRSSTSRSTMHRG
jgi:transcriptional regulator with XRE-family HTH domain